MQGLSMVSGLCSGCVFTEYFHVLSHSSFNCWENCYKLPSSKELYVYMYIIFIHFCGYYLFSMTTTWPRLESFQHTQWKANPLEVYLPCVVLYLIEQTLSLPSDCVLFYGKKQVLCLTLDCYLWIYRVLGEKEYSNFALLELKGYVVVQI